MVSACQDDRHDFGILLSAADLVTVNELRRLEKRPDLKESPGTRFLVHSKNKEGYWGYAQFEEQVVDVMDVLEALYPGHQLMIEVDHSAGHAKYREDGLHVGNMNVRFGGQAKGAAGYHHGGGVLGSGGGEDLPQPRRVEHAVHRRGDDEDGGLEAQGGRDADHVISPKRSAPVLRFVMPPDRT